MRLLLLSAAMLSVSTVPAIAIAQDAAPAAAVSVKTGMVVRSADGRRVGRIDRVNTNKEGAAQSVSIIYNVRYVNVPVSTLSSSGGALVSSLSLKDIEKGS